MCPSKFRRKYHLVRHLSSKHGIILTNTTTGSKSNKNEKKDIIENSEVNNLLMNNFEKFSVEALMMKRENDPVTASSFIGQDHLNINDINNDISIAHLGLQQTFQNLKNLFVNYTLNNVSN